MDSQDRESYTDDQNRESYVSDVGTTATERMGIENIAWWTSRWHGGGACPCWWGEQHTGGHCCFYRSGLPLTMKRWCHESDVDLMISVIMTREQQR